MRRPNIALSLSLGIACGGAIAVSAGALSSLGQDDASLAPLGVVSLFALAVVLIRALARASSHPRPAAAAALGAVGLAPVAFFAAWHQLEVPLGTASQIDPLEAAAAVIAFALIAAAAWSLTAHSCSASRAAGLLALAAGSVVAAAGTIAALERPDPSRYLASLEPVASWRSDRDGRGFEEHRPLADHAVGGTCVGRGCYAHVRRGGEIHPLSLRLERGTSLELVRHPGDQTLLLRANGSLLVLFGEAEELVPSPAALAERLGPPPSFVFLAVIGLLGGVGAWLLRRRQERQRRVIAGARAGYVSSQGWLEQEPDAVPIRLAAPGASGPVLVTGCPASSGYRGAPDGSIALVRGAREELLAALDARMGTLDALALSWVLVSSMPMAAALVRGLAP